MPSISSSDAGGPGVPAGFSFSGAILESPADTRIMGAAALPEDLTRYDAGVVFGPAAEFRWQRLRSGLFRTVCIDDSADGTLEPIEAKPVRIVLWGEPFGDSWYEARIPNPLTSYPPHLRGRRVAVSVKHYRLRHEDGVDTYLYRCVAFEAYEEAL